MKYLSLMDQHINEQYHHLFSKYSNRSRTIKRGLNITALGRLLAFVAAVLFVIYTWQTNVLIAVIGGAIALSVFIFLVVKYIRKKQAYRLNTNLIHINRREIEALRGNITNFDHGFEFLQPSHAYANDLELFGEKSVFQFLNRSCTYTGKNKLASWLVAPLTSQPEIKQRQEAVKELANMLNWRQLFMAAGNILDINNYNDTQLISWAKEENHGVRRLYYQIARWFLPVITIFALIMWSGGQLPTGLFILILLVNRFVLWQASTKAKSLYQKVTKQLETLKNYQRLFRHIEKQEFRAPELQKLKEVLYISGQPASKTVGKLSRISDALESGANMLVDLIVNTVFLWNIHYIIRLEKWHGKYGQYIEKWIETIGLFDAYTSIANYSFNHPGYTYPEFTDDQVFHAEQMGHLIINPENRVCNDITINTKGQVFIITGANMAGKSTFLRTIGVNMVLGMIGAPVCATRMKFKITRIFTSMNITDSLSKNESYFYAEVKRLKELVDEAMKGGELMVLLDEILTGTNTRDKETASKAFLERLIEMNITSLIATHDLSLTTLKEKYPDKIDNKSFEVDMVKDQMHYDYKIRDGVAKNMNALELLKQMRLIR